MRLLDRYLLRELLIPLGYCLAGFLLFWIAADLFEHMDEFQRRGLGVQAVAAYYALRTPDFLWIILPVALLLAMLYALTDLARRHELTAMRAAGLSLWRIGAPFLITALALSLVSLWVSEQVAPASSARATGMLRDEASAVHRQLSFRNAAAKRIWRAAECDLNRGTMTEVRVDWDLPSGATRKLIAQSAQYTNGVWVFRGVTLFQQDEPQGLPLTTLTNELVVPEIAETISQIRSEIKIGSLKGWRVSSRVQVSAGEIRDYLRWHPGLAEGDKRLLATLMNSQWAKPWTCLVVALLALPFGAASGRRNVFVGVASSVVMLFAFYVIRELSLALGFGGHLPPWAAAWMPNGLFGLGAVWMIHRVR